MTTCFIIPSCPCFILSYDYTFQLLLTCYLPVYCMHLPDLNLKTSIPIILWSWDSQMLYSFHFLHTYCHCHHKCTERVYDNWQIYTGTRVRMKQVLSSQYGLTSPHVYSKTLIVSPPLVQRKSVLIMKWSQSLVKVWRKTRDMVCELCPRNYKLSITLG